MQEKLRVYLDNLFSALPDTPEVNDVKEELYTGMVERYKDAVADGMDEQEAYDSVIDGIGDLHELFDEINTNAAEGKNDAAGDFFAQGKTAADSVTDFMGKMVDFAGGFVQGLFNGSKAPLGEMTLVNTINLSLEGIQNIEVSYLSDALQLLPAEGDELVVKEYMNRSDDTLFATVNISAGSILIRNGRRQGIFGLRSHVEVYVPQSYHGSLSLTNVSGSLTSNSKWELASFVGRSVSGEVSVNDITAANIKLSTTSGSVLAEHLAGKMDLHSVSGSVRVNDAQGGGSFKTTSGGVRVYFTELTGDVDASSISGGVRLGLPQDTSFEFDGRSVSGSIHTAFDELLTFQRRNKAQGFVGSAPFYHVRAATTSGSIHVND